MQTVHTSLHEQAQVIFTIRRFFKNLFVRLLSLGCAINPDIFATANAVSKLSYAFTLLKSFTYRISIAYGYKPTYKNAWLSVMHQIGGHTERNDSAVKLLEWNTVDNIRHCSSYTVVVLTLLSSVHTTRVHGPKNRHLRTIVQFCRAISSQLRHVSTIGKKTC